LDLGGATPRSLDELRRLPPLVITVCDRAHEEIAPDETWLHWSIADPVGARARGAFDRTVEELRARIHALVGEAAAS
jgi:hypothetical protein